MLLFSGTRYIVVDCGGGTVDITVHEMESKYGNLLELYKATGGPYGSVGKSMPLYGYGREGGGGGGGWSYEYIQETMALCGGLGGGGEG